MLNSGVLHVFWNLYHEFHLDLLVCHFLDWYWCFFSAPILVWPQTSSMKRTPVWKIQVYYFMVVQGCQPPTQEIRPHLRIMVMNHPIMRPTFFRGGVNVAFGKYPQSHDCSTPKNGRSRKEARPWFICWLRTNCYYVSSQKWRLATLAKRMFTQEWLTSREIYVWLYDYMVIWTCISSMFLTSVTEFSCKHLSHDTTPNRMKIPEPSVGLRSSGVGD